jgi:endoribonuclease LACTB2
LFFNNHFVILSIIDFTGEGKTAKEYVSFLLDEVFPSTQTHTLSHILLTHGHDDHQGGLSEIFAELTKRKMLPLPTVHKFDSPTGSFPVKHISTLQDICNGDLFETEGATLQALYSPGHTDDHVCFILKENHALLSGDCILGCGTAVFEDLHSYMTSLKRLRVIMADGFPWSQAEDLSITAIYPGHGPVLSNSVVEKVDEYIAHREERERQIVAYLQRTSTSHSRSSDVHWKSSWEIMSAIYPSTLPPIIKVAAQYNVLHHLSKLEVDGVVSTKWPDLWWFVKEQHQEK